MRVAAFLGSELSFARAPIAAAELAADPAWLTAEGDLRTLPFHTVDQSPETAGMDGFYASRLLRIS